jgi:hypothetical protein
MKTLKKAAFFLSFTLLLFSCKKYVNPPSITLNGNYVEYAELNSSYVELGARAEDYKENDISSDITISNTIDENLVGSYMVQYNVTDKKGHDAVPVERIVEVRNAADYLDGFYSVSFVVITGTTTNFTSTTIDEIATSNTINNRFYVQNPAAFYATVSGNVVTVPLQGDISSGTLEGSGSVDSNGNILLDVDFTSPNDSYTFSMQYDKH